MMLASLLTLGLAASAYALPATGLVERDAPTTGVTIKSLVYAGSGCPANSVGKFVSDDLKTFTLIFDSFVASIGAGAAVADQRKNCQLNLNLQYPSGWQYSILQTTFRGYVGIDAGVTGRQQATYYFSGQSAQSVCGVDFPGPDNENYVKTGSVGIQSLVWSPCGSSSAALNINSEVRLTGKGNGQITEDSLDGQMQYVVGIQWKKC